MAKPLETAGYPAVFVHPAAGRSEIHARRVAVRWRTGAPTEDRDALLSRLGLVPARLEDEARRPAPAVNRTDGLWWVQRADGEPADGDLIASLDASDLVEWAAPAYRGADGDEAVFTVNPTRLLVPERSLRALGGPTALGAVAAPDTQRGSRLPGMVALRMTGRTAIEAARGFGMTAGRGPAGADAAPDVRFETVPFVSPTTDFVPDDPEFAGQWGLLRIEMPRAWDITLGAPSIAVAVLDEGVELSHPDLDVHPQSWNASSDIPDGSPTGNHGTACAGIVAARLDNGQGVAGVAGGAQVMAIATATWADVDIAEGLYFAADNGARVVSMSFGVYPSWGVWDFDLIRDALQYAYDKGVVLVAASGNEDGNTARFPGSDARTICVGGSNRGEERKRIGDSSSEPWWGASYGPDLDVVAPCVQIPTTDRLGGDGYATGDYYDAFNGTSAATPHVAGLAALILSLRPELDNTQVRHIIERTCDKISPAKYAYRNVATKPSGTWHDEVGYGRVNALRALLAAMAIPGATRHQAVIATDEAAPVGATPSQ